MSSATPIGVVGVDRADAPQQLAFAVLVASVTIAPCRSSMMPSKPPSDRVADLAGDVLEGGVVDRPARRRAGGDRHHDLGALALGQLDEGAERRAGAAVGGAAPRRRRAAPPPTAEARERRRHRREGVGLVLHLRDDELHAAIPGAAAARCGDAMGLGATALSCYAAVVMNTADLIAIDTHTHLEVSCRNPFDSYGEEYDRAADKYFRSTQAADDGRDDRLLPREEDRLRQLHRRRRDADGPAPHPERGDRRGGAGEPATS